MKGSMHEPHVRQTEWVSIFGHSSYTAAHCKFSLFLYMWECSIYIEFKFTGDKESLDNLLGTFTFESLPLTEN